MWVGRNLERHLGREGHHVSIGRSRIHRFEGAGALFATESLNGATTLGGFAAHGRSQGRDEKRQAQAEPESNHSNGPFSLHCFHYNKQTMRTEPARGHS